MKERIHELDALRGLAALYVLLLHYTMFIPRISGYFSGGVTGVDLFFMISGFVIFLSLNHTQNIKTFIISRFTRLFPTYWVCVSITFMVLIFGVGVYKEFSRYPVIRYSGNLTMLQHYFNIRDIDPSYWTMIVELLFYVFMGLVFVCKWMKRISEIGYIFLAFCLFYGLFLKQLHPVVYEGIKFWFPLVNHFPLFFAGMLFYKMKFENNYIENLFGIIICLAVQLTLFVSLDVAKAFISFHQYVFLLVIYFTLFLLFVKGYLLFFNIKPLLYLGIISYPVYLLHQVISSKFLMIIFYNRFNLDLYVSMLLSFMVIVTLSSIITFYVEYPSVTTLKRKLYRLARIT